jgi:hypothetical protein
MRAGSALINAAASSGLGKAAAISRSHSSRCCSFGIARLAALLLTVAEFLVFEYDARQNVVLYQAEAASALAARGESAAAPGLHSVKQLAPALGLNSGLKVSIPMKHLRLHHPT